MFARKMNLLVLEKSEGSFFCGEFWKLFSNLKIFKTFPYAIRPAILHLALAGSPSYGCQSILGFYGCQLISSKNITN